MRAKSLAIRRVITFVFTFLVLAVIWFVIKLSKRKEEGKVLCRSTERVLKNKF